MMDAVRHAIHVRLLSDPDHGHQIQHDPDTFVQQITGVGGAPTFRYMWQRSLGSGRDRIALTTLDRVLSGRWPVKSGSSEVTIKLLEWPRTLRAPMP